MQVEIAYLISIVSLAFSVFFGLKSSKHTDTKDIEERVKDNTRINMKLDAIAGTTQEISTMREEINKHNDKIIKLEQSLKSAHHRLDTLEERMNHE
jgi:peptidoglycan hydrolase CwlO-like protein